MRKWTEGLLMKEEKKMVGIKFAALFLFATLAAGCIGNGAKKQVVQQEQKEYALREMLDSCLSGQPNANSNDVARSILADTLKSKFQRFRGHSLPYIEDLPFQYEMCLKYPQTLETDIEKYVVKFGFGNVTSECELSDKYETTFQVFTVLDKETVATLVDGALYHIKGTFRDFANNSAETGFTLPSGRCFIDYPSVISIDDKPYIDLGTLIVDSLSFAKIQ